MSKNAYLLLSDLHYYPTLIARKNYQLELLEVFNIVICLSNNYRKRNYNVFLIFLGDIFHRGIKQTPNALTALTLFNYVCSFFDKVFSLIGNHEFSYYDDNPFWYLISEIEDTSILNLKNLIMQPKGLKNTFNIVDKIEDGNTAIIMNHYNLPIKPAMPNKKVNIGLFHQDIGSIKLGKMWTSFEDIETSSKLDGYDYCFLAHLHDIYGKFEVNSKLIAYFLSTFGRTNHLEIDDNKLERNIPAILINDGNFIRIEDNYLFLKSRVDALDLGQINLIQQLRKEDKNLNKLDSNMTSGLTLYDTLQTSIINTDFKLLLNLLSSPTDAIQKEYTLFLKDSNEEGNGLNG